MFCLLPVTIFTVLSLWLAETITADILTTFDWDTMHSFASLKCIHSMIHVCTLSQKKITSSLNSTAHVVRPKHFCCSRPTALVITIPLSFPALGNDVKAQTGWSDVCNENEKYQCAAEFISCSTPDLKLCSHGLASKFHHSSVLVPLYCNGWASTGLTNTIVRNRTVKLTTQNQMQKSVYWEQNFTMSQWSIFRWLTSVCTSPLKAGAPTVSLTSKMTLQIQNMLVGMTADKVHKHLVQTAKEQTKKTVCQLWFITDLLFDEAGIMVTSLHIALKKNLNKYVISVAY